MKKVSSLVVSIGALAIATSAHAQSDQGVSDASNANEGGYQEIVVTAQRQSQSLQDVPIAVSAFTSDALAAQQIENASDLQLSLPNITFSNGNFTGATFTIRGVGDLCVGSTCDSATAIHVNGSPLRETRLFETEYFDLERIEVLRGPQGTLFGRNATSGVINVVTAKPEMDAIHASGEAEYGNYDSIRLKGMLNVPLDETLALRVAGFYLDRDGTTKNVYDNSRIDGRNMWAVRGSVRWKPSVDTTVDLMGYYFKEHDNRLRSQKQLCQRDDTGYLGCLNNRLDPQTSNFNGGFLGTLSSRETLSIISGSPLLGGALGIGGLYDRDALADATMPNDLRTVSIDYEPQYRTSELQLQGRLEQNFGPIKAQITGLYQRANIDSSQAAYPAVQDRSVMQPGIDGLNALAAGLVPGLPPELSTALSAYLGPVAQALTPNGPAGDLCVSLPDDSGLGAYGGFRNCAGTPRFFDRTIQKVRTWSGEAIISSDFDGPFNFLLGGIYLDSRLTDAHYNANGFAIDYISGVLGSLQALGGGLPPSFLATPYYDSYESPVTLKSYGIFGEVYYDVSSQIKLTLGLRYNNDRKTTRARSTLASFLTPYGQTGSAYDSPYFGAYDADPVTPGVQDFVFRKQTFDALTGRAVLEYEIDDDHLLYASYSRGYKSGGFNTPVQVPGLSVRDAFSPEHINAYEIGSKNTFADGKLTLNVTGFLYDYKGLQLSRIIARTSVNDNYDATVWGVEAEAVVRPTPTFTVNLGASYLKTRVTSTDLVINPRDVSAGNPDTVIVKDIINASNCVVRANVGGAAVAQGFVSAVNDGINASAGLTAANGLRGPTPFPADANVGASTGAFSICDALSAAAQDPALGGAISVLEGIGVSLKGKELPQAPVVKFSAGVQNEFRFDNGMSLTPRFDISYTGESYGNIFNGRINKVPGYVVANAQIQLNGTDDRWFVRGFVQNIFDNDALTGLYLTDQVNGLQTNVFTLEPRRYGIAAGFKF